MLTEGLSERSIVAGGVDCRIRAMGRRDMGGGVVGTSTSRRRVLAGKKDTSPYSVAAHLRVAVLADKLGDEG